MDALAGEHSVCGGSDSLRSAADDDGTDQLAVFEHGHDEMLASLAFAPLLFRGWFFFVQEPTQLIVRRLGWSELKHATAFCVLLIATFILAR